jgi:hypothetical protein
VLDASRGSEVFVAVYSRKKFALETLLQQLEAKSPKEPVQLSCGDCRVDTLRIYKEP